jgi:hypothetical protein
MDSSQFDTFVRALGSRLARRALTQTLATGAIAALGLVASQASEAKKKKKKCKKPNTKCGKKGCCKPNQTCSDGKCRADECKFTKSATLWTLQQDCAISRPIEIPNGVTLDGNGKTISIPGELIFVIAIRDQYPGASSTSSYTVRNLIMDGTGCGAHYLLYSDFGDLTVENVTVTNFPCDGAAVRNVSRPGGSLDVRNSTFQNVNRGVSVSNSFSGGTSDVTVRDNTFTNVLVGIHAEGQSVNLVATGNTIVGRGEVAEKTFGVGYEDHATGEVSGNTISNFFYNGSGSIACGIYVDIFTPDVTIGANTFPVPPGSEENVCDFGP